MKIEITSIEEARSIYHALKCTNSRNNYADLKNILDHVDNFQEKLRKLIDKPVETTNEQPKFQCSCLLYVDEKTCNIRKKQGFCDNLIGD